MREQVLVRRVVLVDQELVREVEADAAKRVAGARRLRDVHAAVAVLRQPQAHPLQHGRILLQRRQIFVVDDRRRHVPGRIDGDELHRLRQFGRRLLAGLAGDDARGPGLRAVVHHPQREVRNVQHHVGVAELRLAELARQPAPALHVGDAPDRSCGRASGCSSRGCVWLSSTPVAFRSASDWNLRTAAATVSSYCVLSAFSRDAKPRAQLRHARIFHHRHGLLGVLRVLDELQRRAFVDLRRRASPTVPRSSASLAFSAL